MWLQVPSTRRAVGFGFGVGSSAGALQPLSLLFGPGVLQGAKPKAAVVWDKEESMHAWISGSCTQSAVVGVVAEVHALRQPGSQSVPPATCTDSLLRST